MPDWVEPAIVTFLVVVVCYLLDRVRDLRNDARALELRVDRLNDKLHRLENR